MPPAPKQSGKLVGYIPASQRCYLSRKLVLPDRDSISDAVSTRLVEIVCEISCAQFSSLVSQAFSLSKFLVFPFSFCFGLFLFTICSDGGEV